MDENEILRFIYLKDFNLIHDLLHTPCDYLYYSQQTRHLEKCGIIASRGYGNHEQGSFAVTPKGMDFYNQYKKFMKDTKPMPRVGDE